jgi:hypothetical protein
MLNDGEVKVNEVGADLSGRAENLLSGQFAEVGVDLF